jgi:hypothetical protein
MQHFFLILNSPKFSSPFIYLFIYLFIFGKQQDLSRTKINVPNHYFILFYFRDNFFQFFFSFFWIKSLEFLGFLG